MTEEQFIASVDCCFPYGDLAAGRALIDQACGISPNAAFMIAHELARPPRSAAAPKGARGELLAYLASRLVHPLAPLVIAFAERLLDGSYVPVAEAARVMLEIKSFPGQYCALGLAYMACDDVDGEADGLYEDILREWQTVSKYRASADDDTSL
jgi:hypothetical protein